MELIALLACLTALASRVNALADNGERLKLSPPNAKTLWILGWIRNVLGIAIKKVEFVSLSILSGVSCPGASKCRAQAVEGPDGKRSIKDGPKCEFRCFSASDETMYSATYAQRKHNRDLLLACKNSAGAVAALLLRSIPERTKLIRIHIGGDFFCMNYLVGWILFAALRPNTRCYAYTKSLHFVDRLDCDASDLPSNLRIVCSVGGLFDSLLPKLSKRGYNTATVVYSESDATSKGLEVDHLDNLAAYGKLDFAITLHGSQPAGSEAMQAVTALRQQGDNGYSRKAARTN
jgi:hypothetical protein